MRSRATTGVYVTTLVMATVFVVVETARRGVGYFAINATTMIEDYLCASVLFLAAYLHHRRARLAPSFMVGAWGYAMGGMFVPFAAHLEAWLRNETFRPDHPHENLEAVILKGVIWMICIVCFALSLRAALPREASTREAPSTTA